MTPRLSTLCCLAGLVPLLGACTSAPPAPSTPAVTGRAVLDRTTSTVTLPLDKYGMSPQEVQQVKAAYQLAFGKCAAGQSTPPSASVQAAREELATPPTTTTALFGSWNAGQLAAQSSAGDARGVPLGGKLAFEEQKAIDCVASTELTDLEPITRSHLTQGGAGSTLIRASTDAITQTVADPRFVALMAQRDGCLASLGYAINTDSPIRGVRLPDSSSAEDRLKASIAEATCADKMDFMQQASDIAAGYEDLYIAAHEAELVTLKGLASERVTRAQSMLRAAGVS